MRGEGLAIAFRITFQVRKATNGLKGWIFLIQRSVFFWYVYLPMRGRGADATF